MIYREGVKALNDMISVIKNELIEMEKDGLEGGNRAAAKEKENELVNCEWARWVWLRLGGEVA